MGDQTRHGSVPATIDEVLSWCDDGRAALVRAQSVVEAKDVLDIASTLEHAVRLRDLGGESCLAASALRVRAERRVGELLRAQPKARGAEGVGPKSAGQNALGADEGNPPTLKEQGITPDQSSQYQRLAAVPEERFEEAVEAEAAEARDQGGTNITRAGVMRRIDPEAEMHDVEWWLEADKFTQACERVKKLADVAAKAARFGRYPAWDDLPLIRQGVERTLDEAAEAIRAVRHEIDQRQRR